MLSPLYVAAGAGLASSNGTIDVSAPYLVWDSDEPFTLTSNLSPVPLSATATIINKSLGLAHFNTLLITPLSPNESWSIVAEGLTAPVAIPVVKSMPGIIPQEFVLENNSVSYGSLLLGSNQRWGSLNMLRSDGSVESTYYPENRGDQISNGQTVVLKPWKIDYLPQ